MSLERCIVVWLDYVMVLFCASLVALCVDDTLNLAGLYAFVGLSVTTNTSRRVQAAFSTFIDMYTSVQALDRIEQFSNLQHERDELNTRAGLVSIQSAPKLSRHSQNNHRHRHRHRHRHHHDNNKSNTQSTPSGINNIFVAATKDNKPAGASVEFVGVSLEYSTTQHNSDNDNKRFESATCGNLDGELALRAVSFKVRPGEKVGIVGRTGAGKTSLVAALFRLYHFEGFVLVGGQDRKALSDVEAYRRSLSIIPQEPALFSGSLRHNLDTFGEHSDAELWAALETVQLFQQRDSLVTTTNGTKKVSIKHPCESLDIDVGDAGSHLSVGQRQLVCLARAIIKRSKVLVLDEATASVDAQTDALIQTIIRGQFANCTVLTVAHRIDTTADSDRVLVMDRGQVCEFSEPGELIKRPGGAFMHMVTNCGEQQAQLVRARIKKRTETGAHKN